MKNEVAISEYDMIGAELYYCYNYIDNVKKIENSINYLNGKLSTKEKERQQYASKEIFQKKIQWKDYPEIQERTITFYNNLISNVTKELDEVKSKVRKRKIILRIGIIFLIIAVLLIAFGFYSLINSNSSHGSSGDGNAFIRYIISWPSGLVLGMIALGMLLSCNAEEDKERKRKISEKESLLSNYRERVSKGIVSSYDVEQIISEKEAISIFRKYNPNFFSNLEKEKASYQNRINEHKLTLTSIKNEFQENMSIRNTIIPSVYHNEEDIKNLIDYYVRRRGDTWKELVNEYEHDKKLNQIIFSIDNLSNQVNILTNGVVQCFNIIGQQLGIINQSVNSLQVATSINLDRISEIENQQERRLCELTSSIQNMNKQTKVIIESK